MSFEDHTSGDGFGVNSDNFEHFNNSDEGISGEYVGDDSVHQELVDDIPQSNPQPSDAELGAAGTSTDGKTGRDGWTCPLCSEFNFPSRVKCFRRGCTYAKEGSSNRSTTNDGGQAGKKPGDWTCDVCGGLNYSGRVRCFVKTCTGTNNSSGGSNRYGGSGAYNGNSSRDRDYGNNSGSSSNEAPVFRTMSEREISNALTYGNPGDWICDRCDNHNYYSKNECRRCKTAEKTDTAIRTFEDLQAQFAHLKRGKTNRSRGNDRGANDRYASDRYGGGSDRGGDRYGDSNRRGGDRYNDRYNDNNRGYSNDRYNDNNRGGGYSNDRYNDNRGSSNHGHNDRYNDRYQDNQNSYDNSRYNDSYSSNRNASYGNNHYDNSNRYDNYNNTRYNDNYNSYGSGNSNYNNDNYYDRK